MASLRTFASGKSCLSDLARSTRADHAAIPSRSTFKRLDSDITQFRLSLPREYQSNAQVFNADQRHIMITAMPQFAGMLLHEPFFGVNEADPSAQKCILAARSIMDTIHTLQGTLGSRRGELS